MRIFSYRSFSEQSFKRRYVKNMYGAIIGDIAGSTLEFKRKKNYDFQIFLPGSDITDDTIMTIAVARALMQWRQEGGDLHEAMRFHMRDLGRKYPNPLGAYGSNFASWLRSNSPIPYYSCGNGSAMRASPCGLIAASLEEALELAKISAEVTHDHPEGIKGAQATAAAVYLAKTGHRMDEIRAYIHENFYPMDRTCDEIRPTYRFEPTCQKSVPESIIAFLESTGYEDAIRKVISLGGDADTMGAITGSIAWAYYRCQEGNKLTTDMWTLMKFAKAFMPEDFIHTVDMFELICKDTYVSGTAGKEIKSVSKTASASTSVIEDGLERFRIAHEKSYKTALREIKSGVKQSHWMWYIFPQLKGLGYSKTARYYEIKDKEEAIAYWNDPVLSGHLLEISKELLKLNDSISWIMGHPDDLKLKSCMTLFYLVSNESTFKEVLDKFYEGNMDEYTQNKLS